MSVRQMESFHADGRMSMDSIDSSFLGKLTSVGHLNVLMEDNLQSHKNLDSADLENQRDIANLQKRLKVASPQSVSDNDEVEVLGHIMDNNKSKVTAPRHPQAKNRTSQQPKQTMETSKSKSHKQESVNGKHVPIRKPRKSDVLPGEFQQGKMITLYL